jgi:general secretion pathway protein I
MQNKQVGFTLIEVLIALAILAIALPAIIKATSDSIHSTAYLREKTVAHWAMLNALSRVQLGLLPLPDASGEEGKEQQLNKEYFWHIGIDSAEDPYVLRVAITVRDKLNGRILDRGLGFVRRLPTS